MIPPHILGYSLCWAVISFFVSSFHYALYRKFFTGFLEKGEEAFVLSQGEACKKRFLIFINIWIKWYVVPGLIYVILHMMML